MRKSRCSRILQWIGPYDDGELSPFRSARVRGHLEDCLSCRTALKRLRQTRRLVRQGVALSMAEENSDLEALHSRVRDGIRLQESESKGRWWGGRLKNLMFRGSRILVPSAIAAVLIAAVVLKIYNPLSSVIKTSGKNECIVDSVEGANGTVMLFKTHDSQMTVIWLSSDHESNEGAQGRWTPYSV